MPTIALPPLQHKTDKKMRAGGCTVQLGLTVEAAGIVKQAVILARQRGHAQVTPLHVANTMLSSSTGLFRAACLQSHSYPLQCKALELCFSVALNRLPTCPSSGPMLGPRQYHHHSPSLSNALIAAFKRAQAHQRRGSVENQQQPMLTVTIELEQLIISILDDPSVSRVMREAGFSSTQVKSNVEKAVSSEAHAPNPNPSPTKPREGGSPPTPLTQVCKTRAPLDQARAEDVVTVVETLVSGRKGSAVVVGECLSTSEAVVRSLWDKVDKGEVPETLRSIQFRSLPLSSFEHMSREEVEQKLGELRCLVRSFSDGQGVVLYLGDLKWAAGYGANCGEKGRNLHGPLKHVIMELGRLVFDGIEERNGGERFWLLGIATYQTYMMCREGQPSLETLWGGLHPLAIPAGGLKLSLSHDGGLHSQWRSKKVSVGPCWPLADGVRNAFASCADCSVRFDTDDRVQQNMNSGSHGSVTSNLPSWLIKYKEENNKRATSNDQVKTLSFSSISPSYSISCDQYNSSLHHTLHAWPLAVDTKPSWQGQHFWMSDTVDKSFKASSGISLQECEGKKLSPSATTIYNSMNSSSDSMEMDYLPKFKELNAENLKTLCNALEEKISWQKDIIPEIVSTILQCRSGMMRRKEKSGSNRTKEETWLLFHGRDFEGKEKIAMELARLVFGSYNNFISIGHSGFSPTRSDSTTPARNKRSRPEVSHSYLERFVEAIRDDPHRVIMMEDMEQVDHDSQLCITRVIESGRVQSSDGDEVCVTDAIIILSCQSFGSRSRPCSPPVKQKLDRNDDEKGQAWEKDSGAPCASLDLNLCAEENDKEDWLLSHAGLLESVDRTFFFRLPEDMCSGAP